MAQRWLLRLCDETGRQAQWMPIDAAGGGAEIRAGDLDAACAAARGGMVTLVLPGSEVTLHRAALPAASRGKLRAAAPYALEDALAEDLENLHFGIGERDAEGRVAVAVVARDWLAQLLQRLGDAGVQVQRILAEPLLLPEPEEGYTLLLEGERALVRGPGAVGFATESELLPAVLAGDGQPPPPLQVFVVEGARADLGLPVIMQESLVGAGLGLLRRGLGRPGIDLMQGEFSAGEALGRSLRRWSLSLGLAAALLLAWLGSAWLQTRALDAESARLSAQVESILRESFPDLRRVVNPRAQMRQRLASLQGRERADSDFLDILAEVSAGLASASGVSLTAVNYRRGRLDLELSADRIAALYELQQRLAADAKTLRISVQSANSEQGRAQGRIRVEVGAG